MRLKKVKNAIQIIEESTYYVYNPTENRGKWNEIFLKKQPIHIEIGMGKGNFIIQMAQNHPEINFIGIEKYDSVLVRAVGKLAMEKPLDNLKLVLLDASTIDEVFEKEIDRIYLNFSDPWPKKKHAKRRLTSEEFLKKYETIFVGHREIFQKTDNSDFFDFSKESLLHFGYRLENVTDDLHSKNIENVMTEYEERFSKQGIKIHYLEAYR